MAQFTNNTIQKTNTGIIKPNAMSGMFTTSGIPLSASPSVAPQQQQNQQQKSQGFSLANSASTTPMASTGMVKLPTLSGTPAPKTTNLPITGANPPANTTNLQTNQNPVGSVQAPDIATQIKTAQDKVNTLQNQLSTLQGAGYTGQYASKEPVYDAMGNLVQANQLVAGGTQPNTNPYTATASKYSGLVGGLAGMASQSSPEYQAALKQYSEANEALKALQTQAAEQTANIQGSRTNLAEAGGEQGILQGLVAGKEAALTGEMTAAQQAAQTATGQQQVQQTGMGTAAGLAAPQPATSLGYYSPTTGEFIQYGGGQGGGAATAGGVGTQVQQGAAVQTMTGQQAQAKTLATNLGQLLDTANPNIFSSGNASVLTNFGNQVAQWIDKNTGDPNYQNFANLINEISSRYASILNQSGGTPTDQSTLSHAIINSLAGGQDIKTILALLDKNATDSINALRGASQTNAAANQTSGTSGGNTFGSFFGR